jgi:hypothetical protein
LQKILRIINGIIILSETAGVAQIFVAARATDGNNLVFSRFMTLIGKKHVLSKNYFSNFLE